MGYEFVLSREAAEDLAKLSGKEARRIIKKLQWLEKLEDLRTHARWLINQKNGDVRFRVGDYRMIGVVSKQGKTMIIVKIGHRKNIYQN